MDIKAIFSLSPPVNTRLKWVDYAKGIAIMLVVYRHFLIGINRSGLEASKILMQANEVVYTFRMPLFFILSGIFIRKGIEKRSFAKFVNTKLETILYPYLVWTVIQISLQLVLKDYINADRTWVDYTYIFVRPRSVDQFWFLYALFNTSIIFLLAYKLCGGNKYTLLACGLVFQGLFMFLDHIPVLNDVLQYFFYLAIGDFCARLLLDPKTQRKISSWGMTALLVPLFAAAQWVYFANGQQVNIFVLTAIALIGSTLMFNLSFIMASKDVLGVFPFVGNFSLYVYLLHAMVGAASRIFLVKVLHLQNVPLLLLVGWCFAVLVPIFFYRFSLQAGLWWLFQPRMPAQRMPAVKAAA